MPCDCDHGTKRTCPTPPPPNHMSPAASIFHKKSTVQIPPVLDSAARSLNVPTNGRVFRRVTSKLDTMNRLPLSVFPSSFLHISTPYPIIFIL